MSIRTPEHNAKIGAANKANGRGKTPTKKCPHCFLELSRKDDFGIRKNGYTNAVCKKCASAASLKYQKERIAREPEYAEKLRKINRRVCLMRYSGSTPEQYEELLKIQNGVCAICGGPPQGKSHGKYREHFDVDHDHITGVIRGLLCGYCNRGIGFMNDDPERMMAAAKYILRNRK